MTNEEIGKVQSEKIAAAFRELQLSVDTRILFTSMLGYASVISNRLIAGKVYTADEVTQMFAACCADAITPTDEAPPKTFYIDGEEKLGEKH